MPNFVVNSRDFSSQLSTSLVAATLTLAGELSAISGLARNATVGAEKQSVLRKFTTEFTTEGLRDLEEENSALARKFIQLVLKCEFSPFPGMYINKCGEEGAKQSAGAGASGDKPRIRPLERLD